MEQSVKFHLINNKGYSWVKSENCFTKGYLWRDNHLFQGSDFNEIISKCKNENDLSKLLRQANGFFAGAVRIGAKVLLFVDHVSSIQLFYNLRIQTVYDAVDQIAEKCTDYDMIAIAEVIKTTMYSCNTRTFDKDTVCLLAGTILSIDNDGVIKENKYYEHIQKGSIYHDNREDYLAEIDDVNEKVFTRLLKYLRGRTAIIPLSGGYDSRFIAAMLKKMGYEDVVCYTYGFSENTYETAVSKKVADKLGFRHYCILLDEKKWDGFFEDETIKKFLDFGFTFSNLPHIQEVIALKELTCNPEFPKEGVVLPGFCGDLFGGSYTLTIPQTEKTKYTLDVAVNYIFDNNFRANSSLNKYNENIKQDIKSFLKGLSYQICDYKSFNSAQLEWFISHKVSQFILPCLKTFEFFGYSWDMPLWDRELLDFWYGIPNELKQDNSLYDFSLFDLLFKKQNIDYEKKKRRVLRYINNHKNGFDAARIKRAIYGVIMKHYYKTGKMLYFGKESNNFDYLCRLCYQRIKTKDTIKFSEIVRFETLVLWWIEQKIPCEIVKELYR